MCGFQNETTLYLTIGGGKMKMGFCETDITPDAPVTMVGFNRADNISKGVLDCLAAQVTVWENNGLYCLAAIDNIGFNKKESDQLRDLIGLEIGEGREKVMISFSHTHSAVNTAVEKGYYEMLCIKICNAARKAKESMENVSIGWDNAVAEIGVNRRSFGKVDRRVGVLKVCGENNDDTKLMILRLTAHANVLKRDNYFISADYFGTVRRLFSEKYHCPVMIIQGSAGNIAPKYYCSTIVPIDGRGEAYINSVTALDDIAQEVLSEAEAVIHSIKAYSDIHVSAYSKYITLKSKVPSMAEAYKIAGEAAENCGIDGSKWLDEVKELNENNINFQTECLEVQYFCIGNWCLCGIPNETMTEFAIDIEEMLLNPYFYFNGYTNGCTSYFPTKEEYDLGGYEVYWAMLIYFQDYGRVYPYHRESFDEITKFVAAHYSINGFDTMMIGG